jgi:hypothetical protein
LKLDFYILTSALVGSCRVVAPKGPPRLPPKCGGDKYSLAHPDRPPIKPMLVLKCS